MGFHYANAIPPQGQGLGWPDLIQALIAHSASACFRRGMFRVTIVSMYVRNSQLAHTRNRSFWPHGWPRFGPGRKSPGTTQAPEAVTLRRIRYAFFALIALIARHLARCACAIFARVAAGILRAS